MPITPVLRMRRQADVWVESSLVFLIYRANYRHLSKKGGGDREKVYWGEGLHCLPWILVLCSWAVSPQCPSVENRTNNSICLTGLLWHEINWYLSVWKSTQYTLSLMSWQRFYQWSWKISYFSVFFSELFVNVYPFYYCVFFLSLSGYCLYILCILAFCLTYLF